MNASEVTPRQVAGNCAETGRSCALLLDSLPLAAALARRFCLCLHACMSWIYVKQWACQIAVSNDWCFAWLPWKVSTAVGINTQASAACQAAYVQIKGAGCMLLPTSSRSTALQWQNSSHMQYWTAHLKRNVKLL